jgi:hypothetical protein
LRINANDSSNDKDDIVAEFKCDTKDFLEQCFVCPLLFSKTSGTRVHAYGQNEPADFLLSQADGSNRSVIRMTARYVPVQIALEPRESINSESILHSRLVGR